MITGVPFGGKLPSHAQGRRIVGPTFARVLGAFVFIG